MGNRCGEEHPVQGDLIELRKVVKTFKNAAGEFVVLKGIDASFREGEFVSIVGRSGSGKSTLLNMVTGIDHPTSGSVRIGDTLLHTLNESKMAIWRGRMLGIVFQFFQLLPMLTLLENVMLPMDFAECYPPAEREPRARDLLKLVGLEGLEHKYPAGVAGGQQQSAAVARALANNPPVLVADEPTGNLDTVTAERVLDIFAGQVAQGKTVLMVTHDNSLAERAQRKLVITDGELVNEWISRAFPDLPHAALLRLSHAAQPVSFQSGETLFAPESQPDLLLISRGRVEAVADHRPIPPALAGGIGPGGVFHRADSDLQVELCAVEPVEALVIDRIPESVDIAVAAPAKEGAD
ncbi:MAG TPA: ATP-binding cassette domain-containing protein [Anaerolineaceae bacterium]|nr:ATP-binding cassette domain-containing protein [Anaerolineaceae bacterium]